MSFSELLGQTKAITLLTRAVTSERLAHAYLFAGPDGVGKNTAAQALAAVLLCRAPNGLNPCGTCPGCRKFLSGNHPDLLQIRPEGAAIKIDQIRQMKKALTFSPFESRQRVVLIEDVHTMRREAGNSLLKVLEEPPPNNLLILIGSTAGALLDTIISRCQVIPFAPLPLELAASIILRHRPELDQQSCRTLAALADGCPGQALALEAEGTLPLYRKILDAWIDPPKSTAERVEQALVLAVELTEAKEGMESLLMLLRIFLKNAMAARTDATALPFPTEVLRARERWNLVRLSAKMAAIDLAEQALARNCNRGLTSEVLLLTLFDLSP
ncbi:MAG: DNA polymerase III subunit delta' [Desulfobulbus sp.]|nr:DNA polymerase III subunit delta' [Desulfobulbus sp.]